MYHRVADLALDPYRLAVSPDRFAAHVELLASTGCVVPLAEVLTPSSAPRIAITFDDGYLDNATVAAPLLAAAGLPATWFITTRTLGGRRFWWDRLGWALLGPHDLPAGVDAEVAGRALWLDLRDAAARDRALRFLHRRLRPLPPDELADQLGPVLAALGAPEPPADELTMTPEQVRGLAATPGFEVGAHTRTHLQLRDQSPQLQREEVLGSVEDLTALLQRPVTSFAFPFGSRSAVGDLAPVLTREAGCVLACSTDPGPVPSGADPHLLPRLTVFDWTADELAGTLGRPIG
jgi:peptidoglycan/xylan/chitin deacetylase (PgdA/CDA1 family)